jgi:hypothetical protein
MSAPLVDVVVLTWNDGPLVDVAVRSALDSQAVDVRVVVIDNGSDDEPKLPSDERVHLVRNPANRGVAGGRNQGIRMGSASLVCLLDSDARLHPGALAALVAALDDAKVGIAVPVFTDQAPEASAGRAPTLRRKLARVFNLVDTYEPVAVDGADSWPVDFGIGACQVFHRDVWEQVHGIDESFFYGPEDVDFCMRAGSAGWEVVQVADAAVDHPPRRRFRRLLTRRGIAHAWAVTRFLVRHRSWSSRRLQADRAV